MFEIDVRGLACPEPVVRTQNALKADPEGGKVIGDTVCSRENITRFATAKKYDVSVETKGGEYTLTLTKKS